MRIDLRRSFQLLSLTVAILAMTGCGSTRSQLHGERDRIILASGGGFSGAYSGYVIGGDGVVSGWRGVNATPDSFRPLFLLSPDSTDHYFRQLDEMSFSSIDFNAPGNLTYFIEQASRDSSHIVRWGDVRYTPPAPVADFYSRTIEMILGRSQSRQRD